jgi:hypothetical protein
MSGEGSKYYPGMKTGDQPSWPSLEPDRWPSLPPPSPCCATSPATGAGKAKHRRLIYVDVRGRCGPSQNPPIDCHAWHLSTVGAFVARTPAVAP